MAALRNKAENGDITISEAVNLAIHEEMLRDPTTTSKCKSFAFFFESVHHANCIQIQSLPL
jgi:hypothetical protein